MVEKESILVIFSIAAPFITRPVLTTVCTVIILLLGAVAFRYYL